MSARSKYFLIQELVPPSIYKAWGERSWWFIDHDLVVVLDFMREYYGVPVTVNNWHIGGKYTERGFRTPTTKTGGKLSQHRFGRGADVAVKGLTPKQVYMDILKNEKMFLSVGLTAMEDISDTPTWVHIDTRWTELNGILVVKPSTVVTPEAL